jgi:hypothetical protein
MVGLTCYKHDGQSINIWFLDILFNKSKHINVRDGTVWCILVSILWITSLNNLYWQRQPGLHLVINRICTPDQYIIRKRTKYDDFIGFLKQTDEKMIKIWFHRDVDGRSRKEIQIRLYRLRQYIYTVWTKEKHQQSWTPTQGNRSHAFFPNDISQLSNWMLKLKPHPTIFNFCSRMVHAGILHRPQAKWPITALQLNTPVIQNASMRNLPLFQAETTADHLNHELYVNHANFSPRLISIISRRIGRVHFY